MLFHSALRTLSLFGFAALLSACNPGFDHDNCTEENEEDCETDSGGTTTTYFGPHYWELVLSGSSNQNYTLSYFNTPTSTTANFWVSGTLSESATNNFTVLSVDDSDNIEGVEEIVVINANDYAYFFMDPKDKTKPLVSLLKKADCPTASITKNFIRTHTTIATDDEDTAFSGVFEYRNSQEKITLNPRYNLNDPDVTLGTTVTHDSTESCNNGMIIEDDIDAVNTIQYLSENNSAMVSIGRTATDAISSTSEAILVLESTPNTLGTLNADDYIGFVYNENDENNERSITVNALCTSGDTATLCTINDYDPSSDTQNDEWGTLQLDAFESPSTGFATGTITLAGEDTETGNLSCHTNTDILGAGTTEKLLNCVGQITDPNDADNKQFVRVTLYRK